MKRKDGWILLAILALSYLRTRAGDPVDRP